MQVPTTALAAKASRVNLTLSEIGRGGENTTISVPANKSRILKVDVPFADLLIGNPEIADVHPLTDKTVYILGKTLGTTSLAVYGKNKQLLGIVDIEVTFDIETLKDKLNRLVPNEVVEVYSANASIVLKGQISSAAKQNKILEIAEQYAPNSVTNMMSIANAQQVMLKVKFAEVSREISRDLSINAGVSWSNSAGLSSIGTQNPVLPSLLSGTVGFLVGSTTVNLRLDAGEEKGLVKTLAEPNLIALSGDTASFLAGGEFPIPVTQDASSGGNAITIEYKEFGVRLSFTPTVLGDELINLVVAPEVSALAQGIVETAGFRIPSLTVRRAETTVELRAGQSFAIAGLIQSNFTDTIDQIPGFGNIPILGALGRSSAFERKETELVIIITPYLVQPAIAGTLESPTDYFLPPSDFEIFGLGKIESEHSGKSSAPSGGKVLSQRGSGGFEGKYGYVIK